MLSLTLVVALLSVLSAHALINPHFTPIHLVKQSALILFVDLKQGQNKDQFSGSIRRTIKGKTDLKELRLDLSRAINTQNADTLRELISAEKQALFFVGEFVMEKDSQGPAKSRGFLHIGGQWAEFDSGKDDVWVFNQIDTKSQGVWAGGTDMLRRAVDYILEDDDPEVPVADGAAWSSEHKLIDKLGGKIKAVRPVDLAGEGKLVLFVARDQGDRLYTCDAKTKKFSDVTDARGLQSRSQACAWGDFAGKGRLDLISFDGKSLSLHEQQRDGKFQIRSLDFAGALENGVIGLAALDCGNKRNAGLLVTTNSAPLCGSFDTAGKVSFSALESRDINLAKLGQASPCLPADFDGDGIADVLLPCTGGSVWYRGLAPGKYAPGALCSVKVGAGPASVCVGDFDGDGRFDILGVNKDGVRIWQNDGNNQFSETLNLSGEIAYISKPGGVDCMVGDVNNDGRQDALLAYSAAGPQLFFNRGYRSFGHAHTLDLAEKQLLPVAEQGQQSACLGDFDGDGAQDMVLALKNGEIVVFFRENDDREARSAIAVLSPGSLYKGPVSVMGWNAKRCLGAWNVLPGTGQAFLGRRDAGPLTLKWRLPGGKEQQQEVILEKQVVRVEIK